jgi:alpha-1,2-rhamnosyltransferase
MPNLYIDFSETHFSKLNTGIQRVVRNIIARKEVFNKYGFDNVYSVIQIGGNFYKLELDETLPLPLKKIIFLFALKLRHLMDFFFKFINSIRKKKANDLQEVLSNKAVDNVDDKATLHMSLVLFCRKILKYIYVLSESIDTLFINKQRVFFSKGDLLFLPDAFWPDSFSMPAVTKAKTSGVKVVTLIHDIFPITHSQLVEEKNKSNFKSNFPKIVQLTDGFIFNSEFTQTEVTNYLQENCKDIAHVPSAFFYLGCDFVEIPGNFEFPFENESMYLMVGTIEPRKNHDFVLESFHRYWELGGTGRLVIVGKIGWNCDETLKEIHTSPYFNKYLFCFNQVSDSELMKFYSSCSALIFASLVEGFGLPMVEAMSFNKIVFASDIPVFREVAQEYPFYFDLEKSDSLICLMNRFESDKLDLNRMKPVFFSWDESVNQLASRLSGVQSELVQ